MAANPQGYDALMAVSLAEIEISECTITRIIDVEAPPDDHNLLAC
jgi:hypothetical protein